MTNIGIKSITDKYLAYFFIKIFVLPLTETKTLNYMGRKKLAESVKKTTFSLKLRPDLIKRINRKTKNQNRSAHVEKVLEENY